MKATSIAGTFLSAIALATLLVACGDGGEESQQTPTPRPSPAVPQSSPTPEVTPTAISSPTVVTTDTLEWTTYRNDEYGFKFEYPESCEVVEHDDHFDLGRIQLVILESEGLSLSEYVDRFVDERTKEPYGWKHGHRFTHDPAREPPYDVNTGFTPSGSIGGKDWIAFSYRFGGTNRYGEVTFVERNGVIYIFGLTAGGWACEYEPDVYTHMLSTFRFIE